MGKTWNPSFCKETEGGGGGGGGGGSTMKTFTNNVPKKGHEDIKI